MRLLDRSRCLIVWCNRPFLHASPLDAESPYPCRLARSITIAEPMALMDGLPYPSAVVEQDADPTWTSIWSPGLGPRK